MWWMDPEVSDNCDPNPSVNCAQDRYFCFPLGVTQATCTAVDRSGNRSTCTYTVTVREKDDFIPPVITCPADIMKSTTSMRCEPVAFSASATDNCGPATVTCTPASGFCFPIGKTLVTCTATDKSNNKSTCTFNVMVMMMGDLVGTGNNGAVASDKRILNDKTTGESNTNRDFNLPASQKLHYEFQAFPNPVGNFVNLELKQYQGKQVVVQMFNTLGQQVYNANLKEVSSELYKVDTQNLSSGTYYIKVVAEGIETTAKMVTKN